jgi:ubiquinone/menaquinone biosynthesis C-methylase UbiE
MERNDADCAFADFQLFGIENPVWRFGIKTMDDLARTQGIPGAGTIMRRSLWEQVGGYCEAPELRAGNEDWDFWIGAATFGFSAARVSRPLYFYRRHALSMSNSVLSPIEWQTREFILRRHPKFFGNRDRARVFRSNGLVKSASANLRAKRRLAALLLTLRAVVIDPWILLSDTKSFLRRGYRMVRGLVRTTITQLKNLGRNPAAADQSGQAADDRPRNWEAMAPVIHERYGYLSHDYLVLTEIIEKIGARSVLEIGCGSGRLVPVYLLHAMNPIWLQDISDSALNICRARFFQQKQIQYFSGDLECMAPALNVNLIVSTRVLQHIIDEDEFMRKLTYLSKRARFLYINESTIGDNIQDRYIKERDYNSIFRSLGCRLRYHDEMEAEGRARQSWKLFETPLGADEPILLNTGLPYERV